jgi:hypothetical protein
VHRHRIECRDEHSTQRPVRRLGKGLQSCSFDIFSDELNGTCNYQSANFMDVDCYKLAKDAVFQSSRFLCGKRLDKKYMRISATLKRHQLAQKTGLEGEWGTTNDQGDDTSIKSYLYEYRSIQTGCSESLCSRRAVPRLCLWSQLTQNPRLGVLLGSAKNIVEACGFFLCCQFFEHEIDGCLAAVKT